MISSSKHGAEPVVDHGVEQVADHSTERIVIIGSGIAGFTAAKAVRDRGFQGAVTMFTLDSDIPYDKRTLHSDCLSSRRETFLCDKEFFKNYQIDLHLKARVTKLDTVNKIVLLSTCGLFKYSSCLIASGNIVSKLQVPGGRLPHICYLRTLGDAKKLRERLEAVERVAVIGNGPESKELMATLRGIGKKCELVSPYKVKKVEPESLLLANDTIIDASLVVVMAPAKPATDFVSSDEVKKEANGQILIDQYSEISVEGVFAAGDVAKSGLTEDVSSGLLDGWNAAIQQAHAAAKKIVG